MLLTIDILLALDRANKKKYFQKFLPYLLPLMSYDVENILEEKCYPHKGNSGNKKKTKRIVCLHKPYIFKVS